jgi:regulator of protease activity HflC (stomatin/prohibitin superfamily)
MTPEQFKDKVKPEKAGGCLFALIAGLFLVQPILKLIPRPVEIPPAQVGIKFSATNGFSEQLLKPQVVWTGYQQRLILYPTNIHNATYTRGGHGAAERAGNDSINTSTNEGAILPVDVTVAYHVDPANVLTVYQNFGTNDIKDIQTTFIRPVTNWAMNTVSGTRSVFELTSKERATFGTRVKEVLGPKLEGWGITVDDVLIGEIYPPDDVKAKVDERIGVRAELETATVGLKRAEVEAETIRTKAREQSEVNKRLGQAGDQTLQLRRIELRRKAIEKWDGAAPLTGDGKIPFTNQEIGR